MQATGVGRDQPWTKLLPVAVLFAISLGIGAGVVSAGTFALLPVFALTFFGLVVARPEYGVAMFLSTFLMAYPRWLQGSGYLTLNNVLGGILAVVLTYQVYREQDLWFLRRREIQLLMFVILTYFLSERLNGPDPMKVDLLGARFYAGEGLRLFANRVAFTLFFINYIRTPAQVRMIYVLALSFMLITTLTGLQTVFTGGGDIYGYRAATGVEDLGAGQLGLIRTAANPNRLAMFAILAIAGLWYFMQFMRIPGARVVIVPTVVVLSLVVFMTASRSGLLGLGVCVIAILLDGGFSLRKILSFAAVGLLLFLAIGQFVPSRSLERITNLPGTEEARFGEGAGSIERRQYTWMVALDMVKENPLLGVGMGNWPVARFLSDPARSTASPHNSYLLALAEGGVLCLLGFLALLWKTWWNLRDVEAYVTAPASPLGDLAWIVKATRVSFLVFLSFSVFADLWNLVVLFLIVGLAIVFQRLVVQTEHERAFAFVP